VGRRALRCLLHLAHSLEGDLVVHGRIPQQEPVGPGALGARSWLLTKSGPQKLSTLLE